MEKVREGGGVGKGEKVGEGGGVEVRRRRKDRLRWL